MKVARSNGHVEVWALDRCPRGCRRPKGHCGGKLAAAGAEKPGDGATAENSWGTCGGSYLARMGAGDVRVRVRSLFARACAGSAAGSGCDTGQKVKCVPFKALCAANTGNGGKVTLDRVLAVSNEVGVSLGGSPHRDKRIISQPTLFSFAGAKSWTSCRESSQQWIPSQQSHRESLRYPQ